MRIYAKDQVCSFRFSRAVWGAFSNFQPLAVPIVAGPWVLLSSEALYQAAKFATRPDVQQRIAEDRARGVDDDRDRVDAFDRHNPSATIHLRNVSTDTQYPCTSINFSHARVGAKSS